MALADRIAILDRGTVRQVGAPADIFRRPTDRFVAGFVGVPHMGFLPGRVREPIVEVAGSRVGIPSGVAPDGASVTVGVRPEDWDLGQASGMAGTVATVEELGDYRVLHISIGREVVPVRTDDQAIAVGDGFFLRPVRYHLFDARGRAVYHSEL